MFSVSVAPAKGIPSELEKMRIPQFEQLAVARWLRAPQTQTCILSTRYRLLQTAAPRCGGVLEEFLYVWSSEIPELKDRECGVSLVECYRCESRDDRYDCDNGFNCQGPLSPVP